MLELLNQVGASGQCAGGVQVVCRQACCWHAEGALGLFTFQQHSLLDLCMLTRMAGCLLVA